MIGQQWLRGAWAVGIAAGLCLVLLSGTAAQSGVAGLFPGADLEPPEWVTLGTRATFYAAGASVANASKQWQKDPNGGWTDPATGERYGQIDTPTASGEGIFQADIVGVEGTSVGLQWVLLGLDSSQGLFFGGLRGGATDPGAAAQEIWVHPELLARLPETDVGELKILRGEYDGDGTAHRAIAIANLDPAAYSSWIYDIDTGLLLSGTTRTQGRASPLHAEGEQAPAPNTQLTIIRLLGVRQRDASSLETAPPDWAAAGAQLDYSGTWTFVNPFDLSGQPVEYPVRMRVVLGSGGPTWREFGSDLVVDFAGIPDQTVTTGVAAGAGPFWIDPATLAIAEAGQLVDEDPITGERLIIEYVGAGPIGEAVTIVSELRGITSRATYDVETGILLGVARTEAMTGITTELGLEAMP